MEYKRQDVARLENYHLQSSLLVINQLLDFTLFTRVITAYLFTQDTLVYMGIPDKDILRKVRVHNNDGESIMKVNLDVTEIEYRKNPVNYVGA